MPGTEKEIPIPETKDIPVGQDAVESQMLETLVLASFGVLCTTAFVVRQVVNRSANDNNKKDSNENNVPGSTPAKKVETKETRFKKLQWRFFSAYFLALLGDWLQGPYVYQVSKPWYTDRLKIMVVIS